MLVRVGGAFNELQNAGCNLERWLTRTVIGLSTRVSAKVTSHTLKLLLLRTFGSGSFSKLNKDGYFGAMYVSTQTNALPKD
jgi:hypothetical protein